MMKPERTVSTEREDKQDFISMLMYEGMNNPIVHSILSHYTYKYKDNPQNRLRDILNEYYEEILQALIKALLMQNMELKTSFEEYNKHNVRPILVSKEVFNDLSK